MDYSAIVSAGRNGGCRTPLSNRSNHSATALYTNPWNHKDSSEGSPSPHDSIPDATWVPTGDVAKSPMFTARALATPRLASDLIDLDSESPLSRLERVSFLYGHGTELTPIAEKRSVNTLRTASWSASDLSSLLRSGGPSLGETTRVEHNNDSPPPLRRLRRQHSFSLDDLKPIKLHQGVAAVRPTIHYPTQRQVSSSASIYSLGAEPVVTMANVHAYPQKPEFPPHQDPKTPPELAEWSAKSRQGSATSVPGHEAAIRGSTDNAVGRFNASFRGQRSGHGNLANHPWVRGQRAPGGPSHIAVGGVNINFPVNGNGQDNSTASASAVRIPTSVMGEDNNSSISGVRPPGASAAGGPAVLEAALRYGTTDTGRLRSFGERSGGDSGRRRGPGSGHSYNDQTLCRSCHRPAFASWSFISTLTGRGEGIRAGDDWCTRCAVRKVYFSCCMGEDY